MQVHNGYYSNRPRDEIERLAMIKFHKLEQQCDAENCVQALAIRDSDVLKKGQVVSINAAMKRWYRETDTAIKRLTLGKKFQGYFCSNEPRTWLAV